MGWKTLLLTFMLLAACTTGNTIAEKTDVRIGANLPLNGGLSMYGEAVLEGFMLGIEKAQQDHNITITVIVEDSGESSAESARSARKLIETDNVHAIITTMVPIIGPTVPLAEQAQIPLIYAAATETFANDNIWIFKDSIDAYLDCSLLTTQAIEEGNTRIGVFGTIAEFTDSCIQGIEDAGGAVVVLETYPRGEKDFRPSLQKMKSNNVEALLPSTYADDCILFWQQARELDVQSTFYIPFTQTGCGADVAISEVRDWDANIKGLRFERDYNSEVYQEFITAFREKYNKEPSLEFFTVLAYDWAGYLTQAIVACKSPEDSACIKEQLEHMQYEGAMGPVSYKENRATHRPRHPIEFVNGQWVD